MRKTSPSYGQVSIAFPVGVGLDGKETKATENTRRAPLF